MNKLVLTALLAFSCSSHTNCEEMEAANGYSLKFEGLTGYFKNTEFSVQVSEEFFNDSLNCLIAEGERKYLVDLRVKAWNIVCVDSRSNELFRLTEHSRLGIALDLNDKIYQNDALAARVIKKLRLQEDIKYYPQQKRFFSRISPIEN